MGCKCAVSLREEWRVRRSRGSPTALLRTLRSDPESQQLQRWFRDRSQLPVRSPPCQQTKDLIFPQLLFPEAPQDREQSMARLLNTDNYRLCFVFSCALRSRAFILRFKKNNNKKKTVLLVIFLFFIQSLQSRRKQKGLSPVRWGKAIAHSGLMCCCGIYSGNVPN